MVFWSKIIQILTFQLIPYFTAIDKVLSDNKRLSFIFIEISFNISCIC